MGRSDLVRRAMSKKKRDVMNKEGHAFIYGEVDENGEIITDGCLRRGVSEEVALKIWGEIQEFARYAFNKSHAAAYSVIACQTAWLKAYYPAEFYAALLSSVMHNPSRMSRYIEEVRKRGIKVLPPDVNISKNKFTVKDDMIVFGLGGIKQVGTGIIERIIQSREEFGPFESFLDFCERIDDIKKDAVFSLIKAGAFDYLNIERGNLLNNAIIYINRGKEIKKRKLSGQASFFDTNTMLQDSIETKITDTEPLSKETILSMEKDVLGMYLSGHPLKKYQKILDQNTVFNFSVIDSYDLLSESAPDQSYVTLGGILNNIKAQYTKNGDLMAFATLEDQFGAIDLVIFPKSYEKFREMLIGDLPVLCYGKLCYNEELDVSLCVDNIELLEKVQQSSKNKPYKEYKNGVEVDNDKLIIHLKDLTLKPLIKDIKNILKTSPGSNAVILYFEKENQRFKASDALNVNINEKLIQQLNKLLDCSN